MTWTKTNITCGRVVKGAACYERTLSDDECSSPDDERDWAYDGDSALFNVTEMDTEDK